jgi:hypothetical protein
VKGEMILLFLLERGGRMTFYGIWWAPTTKPMEAIYRQNPLEVSGAFGVHRQTQKDPSNCIFGVSQPEG